MQVQPCYLPPLLPRPALEGGTTPFIRIYTAMYPYSSLECPVLNSSSASLDRPMPPGCAAVASVSESKAASQMADDSLSAAAKSAFEVLAAASTDFCVPEAIEQRRACVSATCATSSPKL